MIKIVDPYTETYKSVLRRASALSYAVPTLAHQKLQNAVHEKFQRAGLWTEVDVMWIFAQDGGEDYSRINHKSPSSFLCTKTAVSGNSPVWDASEGWRSVAGGGYLNTNWNPSTDGVKFIQNDHSFYVWHFDNVPIGNVDMGANTGGQGVVFRTSDITEGAPRISSSSGEFSAGIQATWDAGHHVIRNNSGAVDYFHKGVLIVTSTTATVAMVNRNIYICALNQGGTAAAFLTSARVSIVVMGSKNLSNAFMHNTFTAYMAGL